MHFICIENVYLNSSFKQFKMSGAQHILYYLPYCVAITPIDLTVNACAVRSCVWSLLVGDGC